MNLLKIILNFLISGPVSGPVGAIIGAFIGAMSAYYFSIQLWKKQLKTQQAFEFVSKYYLPLLSAIEEYKRTKENLESIRKHPCSQTSVKKALAGKKNPWLIAISEKNACKINERAYKSLGKIMETTVKSGMWLIIRNRDEVLGNCIATIASLNLKEIEEISYKPEVIDSLKDRLSNLSIPKLVAEYLNIMEKGFNSKKNDQPKGKSPR